MPSSSLSKTSASAELEDGGQARVVFEVRADGPGAPELELQATLTPSAGGPPIHDGLRLPLPVEAERTLTERVAATASSTTTRRSPSRSRSPATCCPATAASPSTPHRPCSAASRTPSATSSITPTAASSRPPAACSRSSPCPLAANYPLGIPTPRPSCAPASIASLSMQTASGGFGYWPGATEVHVYASAYATWVLQLAAKAGHPVPEDALRRALDDLEARIGGTRPRPDPRRLGLSRRRPARDRPARPRRRRPRRPPRPPSSTPCASALPLFARAFLLMALHRDDPASPRPPLLDELLGNIDELPATAHTSRGAPALQPATSSSPPTAAATRSS
jgi:hypothetical protein